MSKNSPKQNMGLDELTKLLDEQSKMAMSALPDAVGVMKELFAFQQSNGELTGLIKKFMKS